MPYADKALNHYNQAANVYVTGLFILPRVDSSRAYQVHQLAQQSLLSLGVAIKPWHAHRRIFA